MKASVASVRAILWLAALVTLTGAVLASSDPVKTSNGLLEGVWNAQTGVRAFKGIPFALPPVGNLRWRPPQPIPSWEGVRRADHFGPRAMQNPIFSDMVFRSDGMSEDCLYLNVWTPARSGRARLPVLVYFFGGGFVAGDGSEGRYDGESMAQRGVVAVTVNYRLGVFGFLAHPGLTRESPHHASGNYGLLDQNAALQWVHQNIAAFGGDPNKVTIAGESAGSISVSAQMASPLSRDLFARAIGESGALLGTFTPVPLAQAESVGLKFATDNGAETLADLRALSAEKLLQALARPGRHSFPLVVDGYFLTKDPFATFAAGEQARVPLLVGWNSEESSGRAVLGRAEPTLANFESAVKRLYPDHAEEAWRVFQPSESETVVAAATELASARFISYSTWKWADLQERTSGQPVYRYYYSHPRPPEKSAAATPAPPNTGASHSAEIEYALGNLRLNRVYAWTPDDFKVSEIMQRYFANFIKKGDPNGRGLPRWPAMKSRSVKFMRLDIQPGAQAEQHADRYRFFDRFNK